ncbi:MAG: hypothetical protein QXL78_02115 [Methanocellales archaeon]
MIPEEWCYGCEHCETDFNEIVKQEKSDAILAFVHFKYVIYCKKYKRLQVASEFDWTIMSAFCEGFKWRDQK